MATHIPVLRGRRGLALYPYSPFEPRTFFYQIKFGVLYKGLVVGFITLISTNEREASVEYCVDKGYRGRGFATDAVGLVSAWALKSLGLARITAQVGIHGVASQKVLGRNGFNIEEERSGFYHCEKSGPKNPAP